MRWHNYFSLLKGIGLGVSPFVPPHALERLALLPGLRRHACLSPALRYPLLDILHQDTHVRLPFLLHLHVPILQHLPCTHHFRTVSGVQRLDHDGRNLVGLVGPHAVGVL